MKIPSSNYDGRPVTGQLTKVEQSAAQQQAGDRMVEQAAASMSLSRIGMDLSYCGELERCDADEVNAARKQLKSGLTEESVRDGSFVGILAEKYKKMADEIKEKYTGEEYDWQMKALDKAYGQASEGLAESYTERMRKLTGDVRTFPKTVQYYSSYEEAELHRQAQDAEYEKWRSQQSITDEKGSQISSDVLKYLNAAKTSVLDKGFFDWQNLQDVNTDVLNIYDIQKMGALFASKGKSDSSGISDFVNEILSSYVKKN